MDTSFELQTGQAVGVTRHAINQMLALQDGAAALLYCYLLANPQPLDTNQAALILGMDGLEVTRAFTRLKEAALITTVSPLFKDSGRVTPAPPQPIAPPPEIPAPQPKGLIVDDRPVYTSSEIADALERHSDFSAVVKEAESRLGKILSNNDLQTLYRIYDWRGLPAGVIHLLITHCVEEARERGASTPKLNQIDKEAAAWERSGIDNELRAEEYLAELAGRRSSRYKIMSMLQIRGRAPSVTEEKYMNEWITAGHSLDLISLAYDKTVIRTGGMNWKYMAAILKNWEAKGLTTPEEVEGGEPFLTNYQSGKKAPSSQPARSRTAFASEANAGSREKAAVDDISSFLKRVRDEEGI
ncbi:MAG: DnaD domain protein [Oscillospiraceae bacterium]|nr:DnaD domain protein [Oscillospiraceae bacterium]